MPSRQSLCGCLLLSLLAVFLMSTKGQAAEPALHFKVRKLPDAATAVTFSPTSDIVAVGSYETVELWNVADKKKVRSIPVKSGFARSLAFSPDGVHLAVGGYQRIHIYQRESGQLIRDLKGHRGYVTALNWERETLWSASEDQSIRQWAADTGAEISAIQGFPAAVAGFAFSPDRSTLAVVGGDEAQLSRPGFAQLRKVTGELVLDLPSPKMAATDVVFTPDGQQIIVTGFDEKAHLYKTDTGALASSYKGHSRPTNSVALAAGGKLALTASGGRFKDKFELHIWSVADQSNVVTLEPAEGKLTRIAVSPNGHWLAVAAADKTASLWNIEPLRLPQETNQPMTADNKNHLQFVSAEKPMKRIGIIGLDTSHSIAFAKTFNADPPVPALTGMRVTVAYPHGSRDIASSVSRIPDYTAQVNKLGVTVVDSLPQLLEQVDYVLLETNDGRPHLEQALEVFRAGKPVFIDKPVAGSLVDAVCIYEAARHYKVPVFSSSSLRFMEDALAARNGSCGKVLGCDTFSPCSLEATHPDLFWYGIHGVEILFTVMGTGCQSVNRSSTETTDVVMGTWEGGRVGVFRGMRSGKSGYGGNVFGSDKFQPLGNFKGYDPLVMAIGEFFQTGTPPVSEAETLEIYTFMEAADESKRQGGATVSIPETLSRARQQAAERLARLLK